MSKWTGKLSLEQRNAIASAVLDADMSQAAAAREFNVSSSTVQRVVAAEMERRRSSLAFAQITPLGRVKRIESVDAAGEALRDWDGQGVVAELGPVDGEPEAIMHGTLKVDAEDGDSLFPALTLDGSGAYSLIHFERPSFDFAETRTAPHRAMRIVSAGRQLVIASPD